ncbi:hypothetical protein CERSUDRAFT_120242 [Gelatoporia subvermispora B]|uniref:Uncharacterized protein n=1 Tax=Ceriporiopsis subvermispora (strain B) TaxID=914234 RepID=M2QFW7_CERS8|nr:hypothetical protein CERSUDRAFT_120242 [Gelatoporia subvermispora B]
MSVQQKIQAAISPWKRLGLRGSDTSKRPQGAERETDENEELGRRPLLQVPPAAQYSYGATASTSPGPSSARTSPEGFRRNSLLGRVPEEEPIADAYGPLEGDDAAEDDDAWSSNERALSQREYTRKVLLYTFVPLSSLLVFVGLSVLHQVVWREPDRSSPPDPRYFPSPLPELLVSASLWSLSHLLRVPLFNLVSALVLSPYLTPLLFNALYVLLSELLRLSTLPLLHVRHQMAFPLPTWQDPVFHRVWWLALGWALTEAVVGIAQGYDQIALYRSTPPADGTAPEILARWREADSRSSSNGSRAGKDGRRSAESLPLSPRNGPVLEEPSTVQNGVSGKNERRAQRLEEAVRTAVERDLDMLVSLKEREELEEIYGIPVIDIPVFVSCLQRIDSFLLSLGITLIISAAYLRSALAFPDIDLPRIYTNRAFTIAFPLILLLRLFLALLHTPPTLPQIGVHTTAYVGLLVGLGSVFAGLGLWGALS